MKISSAFWGKRYKTWFNSFLVIAVFLWMLGCGISNAAITVSVKGPGGQSSQQLPDSGGEFALNLPLQKNSVNKITVTAKDEQGNSATENISITQVSLESVVVSKVTAERLSVEEVEQLVSEGVIDLQDPENYNVSRFNVVLTINNTPTSISIPIILSKNSKETGYERIEIPKDKGTGGKVEENWQVVVFDQMIDMGEGDYSISVPGVIILEGRIKSLKEFFKVRLMLLNTSGIFTLKKVNANIEFPDGGLSCTLPKDGIVSLGEILPGNNGTPGQKAGEFVIRGDKIGVRKIAVNFGGLITGPGIPDDNPVPFSGSASTTVEVKGPPTFEVKVNHPDEVEANVPYDMEVSITNTGDIPAMYASLELDVGGDAEVVRCSTDEATGEPECENVPGSDVRNLGHILPGETVKETFTINPLRSGKITSCLGISDQNISLQVNVGNIGCISGHFPPEKSLPDFRPTVTVVPSPNATGIGLDSPVAAFFSESMDTSTITTGKDGTFNVYDPAGNPLPGQIRFETINDKTVAIWQVSDGQESKFKENTQYTVVLSQDISDDVGHTLANEWSSTFTTTATGLNDTDPPVISISVEPPVDPNRVIPGQVILLNTYVADQGSGIGQVEIRLKDLNLEGASYSLIDQKGVSQGDAPPFVFAIDSSKLVPGHVYQIRATAFDLAGNAQDATISIVLAESATPPTITFPENTPTSVLHGIPLVVTPSVTGGVVEVKYFLDGSATPFKTTTVPPYQATVDTLSLQTGDHELRAVARDGLNQTGEAVHSFSVEVNPNVPTVSLTGISSGVKIAHGSDFYVTGKAEDPTGISSVQYFIDSPGGNPVASGNGTFEVDTTPLTTGNHKLYIIATNSLGKSNSPSDPSSFVEFEVIEPATGNPPDSPVITEISYPENGTVTVSGTAEPGAEIQLTNSSKGYEVTIYASNDGHFNGQIAGDTGDSISVVAYDYSKSSEPSEPAFSTVPEAPSLDRIEVTPTSISFSRKNDYRDLRVIGYFSDGSSKDITGSCSFSSSHPEVASVDNSGRVAAISSGDTTITVSTGDIVEQVQVNVDIVIINSISVSPESLQFEYVGQRKSLTVTAHYSDGSTNDVTGHCVFTTGNSAIVFVDSSGLLEARSNGQTMVSAYYPGIEPVQVSVTVNTGLNDTPEVEIIAPENGSEVEKGHEVNISVRATDSIGGVSSIRLNTSGELQTTETRQFASPRTNVTEVFTIHIPEDAMVGNFVTVTVSAEDVGGKTSQEKSINLIITDKTAPDVSISSPTTGSLYNFGDTVTVNITANDLSGISKIEYSTSGGMTVSDEREFTDFPGSVTTSFEFGVPYNMDDPEVNIVASATDRYGNKAFSVPIKIIITDADITAPETSITNVDYPGNGSQCTITYEVTSGSEDLDHVELYFRKDGIGTFNRYTATENGNPDGYFYPQNTTTGTIIFDSTRMGGDGTYEFYTVGVDKAGNRESAPVDENGNTLADASTTIDAGTIWTVIDSPLNIDEDNTEYENLNLKIVGATVTISGHHTFHNVELLNGAVLTHPDITEEHEYSLDISVWSLLIDDQSSVDVTGRGYTGGEDYNESGHAPAGITGASAGAGGSYGGSGAAYSNGTPNKIYGDLTDPEEPGSGGGAWSNYDGGDGGGFIKISAINLMVDGSIIADGEPGSGSAAGGGSGGGINISTATLSGKGTITANGGGTSNAGVGGGGGRIAIKHTDMSTMNVSNIKCLGGIAYHGNGANGTVFLRQKNQTGGELVITGQGPDSSWTELTIPEGHDFDSIILTDNARVYVDTPLNVRKLVITGNSVLTHSQRNEAGLQINVSVLRIDEGSSIDVTARGYRGGTSYNESGYTLGNRAGSTAGAGGSYGGIGGHYSNGVPNPVYGDPKNPDELGSGGGAWSSYDGGNGGGRVTINASKAVIVDGSIRADGQASKGSAAGGGSGGSILIRTSTLSGDGIISANGGGVSNAGTPGGGGRIAIYCDYVDSYHDLNGLKNITAFGGHAYYGHASAGTVYIKYNDQEYGTLYIDDNVVDENGDPTGTAKVPTPLSRVGFGVIQELSASRNGGPIDTIKTDGRIALFEGGLEGLRINPDVNQKETFKIVANTEDTITVVTPNEHGVNLTDVASVGSTYCGWYEFGNVVFRRGGSLVLDGHLEVNDTLKLAEYGILTHYLTTSSVEPRLEINVNKLVIQPNSGIDVSAKGYPGGKDYNEYGYTAGYEKGSASGAGGSYGGLGAYYSNAVPNSIYGDPTNPSSLGSGGGAWSSYDGGNGGGRVFITAFSVENDGFIRANGDAPTGSAAGGGSGGTINIVAGSISGTGTIEAVGGGVSDFGVGGGGGRIAIRYSDSLDIADENILVTGGAGYYGRGGDGTLFTKKSDQLYGDLIIDGQNDQTPSDRSTIPAGYTFDNIILRNSAKVVVEQPINVTGELHLLGNSLLTHSQGNESGLQINASTVRIESGSSIDVTGRGYRGGTSYNESGYTLGNRAGSTAGAGGSYGGFGGHYSNGVPNPVYGDPKNPDELGSGGGAWSRYDGGNGGGRVTINASNVVIVNGSIRADGQASKGSAAGGGSGGSILIRTSTLSGDGIISANGGGVSNAGTPGGGGRIAIYCDSVDPDADFNGLKNITAFSGHAYYGHASAGTIYIKFSGDKYGTLFIDDNVVDENGNPDGTATASTPLPHIGFGVIKSISDIDSDGVIDTFQTDRSVTLPPDGLVGLRINPDITQDETFVVKSNTSDTITVVTPNENGIELADVAQTGNTYCGWYVFGNVEFRRGGNLVLGDHLKVVDTLNIAEYGLITHYSTTSNYVPRIDLEANNLIIDSTSSIDVSGKGYPGGKDYNESGRTLNYEVGSSPGAGGSYGGLGGSYSNAQPNSIYGEEENPAELGSGGGAWSSYYGGNGGGRIAISVQTLTINGSIKANGQHPEGNAAGGGSGGSININADSITGNGTIEARGGGQNYGVGGGGGRIAIHYRDEMEIPSDKIIVSGGNGYYDDGEDGTIYVEKKN